LCYRLVMSLNTIRSRCDWCVEHTAHTFVGGITVSRMRKSRIKKGNKLLIIVRSFSRNTKFPLALRNYLMADGITHPYELVLIYYVDRFCKLWLVGGYFVPFGAIFPEFHLRNYVVSREPVKSLYRHRSINYFPLCDNHIDLADYFIKAVTRYEMATSSQKYDISISMNSFLNSSKRTKKK
jgi:hypothetical protein